MTPPPDLQRILMRQAARLAGPALDTLAEAVAETAAEKARALRDPDRPGAPQLARSLHVTRTGPLSRAVEARAPHAVFVEFGTARMAAQPFLGPAARACGKGTKRR